MVPTKRIFYALLLSFFSLSLFSQNEKTGVDVIYLNNGSVFKGIIIEYEPGGMIEIKLEDGQILTLKDEEVKRIVQGGDLPGIDKKVEDNSISRETRKQLRKELVEYKTKGIYNTTFVAFAGGQDKAGEFTLGAGVHNITGKHFKKWLGLGIGIGLDNYSRRGETILPVYLEFRGYPLGENVKFYYSISGGYGFAFKREQFRIVEAKGGYMFHPAVGYRVGTTDGTDINIDIGVKFQDAYFREDLLSGDTEFRDVLFQRFVIRVGLTLWN